MKTVTIQIGNTDHKLSQDQWASFVEIMDDVVQRFTSHVHFKGGPPVWTKWQNCCWVVLAHEGEIGALREQLTRTRIKYSQDSVALTIGETEFV